MRALEVETTRSASAPPITAESAAVPSGNRQLQSCQPDAHTRKRRRITDAGTLSVLDDIGCYAIMHSVALMHAI